MRKGQDARAEVSLETTLGKKMGITLGISPYPAARHLDGMEE